MGSHARSMLYPIVRHPLSHYKIANIIAVTPRIKTANIQPSILSLVVITFVDPCIFICCSFLKLQGRYIRYLAAGGIEGID